VQPVSRLNPSGVHAPAGQYSHVVEVAPRQGLIYIAGQAGIDSNGHLPEGVEAQMHQTWRNLIQILASRGLGAESLVHVNYYLTDCTQVEPLRRIRQEYLPEPPPSSTALVVAALVNPAWLFELDAVAVTGAAE